MAPPTHSHAAVRARSCRRGRPAGVVSEEMPGGPDRSRLHPPADVAAAAHVPGSPWLMRRAQKTPSHAAVRLALMPMSARTTRDVMPAGDPRPRRALPCSPHPAHPAHSGLPGRDQAVSSVRRASRDSHPPCLSWRRDARLPPRVVLGHRQRVYPYRRFARRVEPAAPPDLGPWIEALHSSTRPVAQRGCRRGASDAPFEHARRIRPESGQTSPPVRLLGGGCHR
jgi:hypothetical protein